MTALETALDRLGLTGRELCRRGAAMSWGTLEKVGPDDASEAEPPDPAAAELTGEPVLSEAEPDEAFPPQPAVLVDSNRMEGHSKQSAEWVGALVGRLSPPSLWSRLKFW